MGNYRRNLIFFETNSKWITLWGTIAVLATSIKTLALTSPETFSPVTVFWLNYGACSFLSISVLHGIITPLTMTLPPEHSQKVDRPFYVKQEVVLQPRRPKDIPIQVLDENARRTLGDSMTSKSNLVQKNTENTENTEKVWVIDSTVDDDGIETLYL